MTYNTYMEKTSLTDLSPAAQAVLDAYITGLATKRRDALAAALRAAVAHTHQRQYGECWICDADKLLAIADELESNHD
jgi:endonuclease/exonuclease/phosphatase (EEP) superfamily protein YafD